MRSVSFLYEKDPKKIYAQSFEIIRREAALTHLPESAHPLAIRVAHAAGDSSVTAQIRLSEGVIEKATTALANNMPIFCDANMVRAGIIQRGLKGGAPLYVTLDAPQSARIAQDLKTTRSAAAVELWRDKLEGAIIVIGNAPTALFHLLEGIIAKGWAEPAAILGFPVGFVGAEESKDMLAASELPFVTLLGRRGGSAIASAAFNALTLGLEGDGR